MSEPTETTTHVQQYPRGTPTRPMSRKARLVVTGLLVSISTAGGALLSAKSYTDVHTFDVILALMGSFACLAGVTYDSTMFALALEVVIFCAAFNSEFQANSEDVPYCLAVAAKSSVPLIAVAILSMLVPSFFSNFAFILHPMLIAPLCVFPMLSYMVAYGLILKSGESTWTFTLIGILVIGGYLLLVAWYRNRTHKRMNLLDKREMGIAFCTANAFLISLQQLPSVTSGDVSVIMPALVALTVCTMMCAYLGAIADVWHTVGSGQFWMVALDGGLGIFYFIIPGFILGHRFWILYGEVVYDFMHDAAQGLELDMPVSPLQLATSTAMLMLGIVSTVGVTMTRALCPFGAHLYGKIFCIGMQNTRKVAVCMDWSEGKNVLKEFARIKASINFVVTCEDLKQDVKELQEAMKTGHTLMPYTGERTAHVEYKKVFDKSPEWAHGETYPADILACNKNNTKIVLWSDYYSNTTVKKESVLAGMEDVLGGSIICFENVPNVVEIVEAIASEGYTLAPLSVTTKEFEAMTLAAEDQHLH